MMRFVSATAELLVQSLNSLMGKRNYNAILNNMKVHWPLMGGLLHLVQ